MKSFIVAALALVCVIGLASANYGYGGYAPQQSGGIGQGGRKYTFFFLASCLNLSYKMEETLFQVGYNTSYPALFFYFFLLFVQVHEMHNN